MGSPFVRRHVPNQSVLRIKVTPVVPDGQTAASVPVVATGVFQRPNGQQSSLTDSQLRAGVDRDLSSGAEVQSYRGWIDLTFAAAAAADLEFRVDKPGGSSHQQKTTIRRNAAGADRTLYVIDMKKL